MEIVCTADHDRRGWGSFALHGAAPGRLVDFRRLEDGGGSGRPAFVSRTTQKTRRAWQRRFVRHALQHLDLQLQLPPSVIRVGRARQEEEDERKEEDHEDDLEESAPRGCGQGPEKPDEEKYDWPKQDGEDCGDDPLLCWIVHHVDDGIVHWNSFRTVGH
jgi:hypothetical protein